MCVMNERHAGNGTVRIMGRNSVVICEIILKFLLTQQTGTPILFCEIFHSVHGFTAGSAIEVETRACFLIRPSED
jgi:hypothetical protein